jgi:peroxiredoxin
MTKLTVATEAPDFTLLDVNNQPVQLASFRGRKAIVLIFNRSFL